MSWAHAQALTDANIWTWTHFDACANVVLSRQPNCKAALTTNTPQAAYGPGATSEPRPMNDWSNYVYTVATRNKGVIQYYKVWNDADAPGFCSGATSKMVTMA